MKRSEVYIRSPLTWLVPTLALVISPHLTRFPVWAILLVFILFIWRLLAVEKPGLLPAKWLLLLISIASCTGIFLEMGTLFGKTAGSIILSILLAIKLHESHQTRDYMILVALSFFIIVTNFFFSQSIPTVIFMLVLVVLLLVSLISINQQNAIIPAKQKIRLSIKLTLQALPLMLVLFLLFPRVPGPLWKLPEEKQTATSGLSETMSPGNISKLIQSNELAFRVNFENRMPAQEQLYWRGLVLWYFDGREWQKGKSNPTLSPQLQHSGETISYKVTLEPHQRKWLFGLDIPTKTPDKVKYTNDFLLRTTQKINQLYQYELSSALHYRIQPQISPWERSAGLKIPSNTNPQTLQLGRQLRQQYTSAEEIIQAALSIYRQQEFYYTLQPPLTPGFDPVDQFLFQTRRGFCEHYASSFSLLMRAAGIPSRIVLGYQGGTTNPINQVVTVRQKDAHAWSEVWLQDKGWVRVDPTAAIAPQRIENNLNAALSDNEPRPLHMQLNRGLAKELLFYWDAIDNRWKQWVVGYDVKLQQSLLEAFAKRKIDFSELLLIMTGAFFGVVFILVLSTLKPWKREKPRDPVLTTYEKFCSKLAKAGITRHAYEGPEDFAKRAAQALPEKKDSIQLISRLYIRLRYEPDPGPVKLDQFKQLSRDFKCK